MHTYILILTKLIIIHYTGANQSNIQIHKKTRNKTNVLGLFRVYAKDIRHLSSTWVSITYTLQLKGIFSSFIERNLKSDLIYHIEIENDYSIVCILTYNCTRLEPDYSFFRRNICLFISFFSIFFLRIISPITKISMSLSIDSDQ